MKKIVMIKKDSSNKVEKIERVTGLSEDEIEKMLFGAIDELKLGEKIQIGEIKDE